MIIHHPAARRVSIFVICFFALPLLARSAAVTGNPAPGLPLHAESYVAQTETEHPRFADNADAARYFGRLATFAAPESYPFTVPLARIAASDPDYRVITQPVLLQRRADRLRHALTLEYVRLTYPSFAVIPSFWLDLIDAQLPSLSEAQLDELATMTYQAMPRNASIAQSDGSRRKLTWEDFREYYHLWSKGDDVEAKAAVHWLEDRMVQGNVCLGLPQWVIDSSPFPTRIATAITREAAFYSGAEFEKLIQDADTVIAGKFDLPSPTTDNPKATRTIAPEDVRALILALRAGDTAKAALLEQWLRSALDDDLRRLAEKHKNRQPATCAPSPQIPREGEHPR